MHWFGQTPADIRRQSTVYMHHRICSLSIPLCTDLRSDKANCLVEGISKTGLSIAYHTCQRVFSSGRFLQNSVRETQLNSDCVFPEWCCNWVVQAYKLVTHTEASLALECVAGVLQLASQVRYSPQCAICPWGQMAHFMKLVQRCILHFIVLNLQKKSRY